MYVIGNGFDLWHGLPTSYAHFYGYALDRLEERERFYWFKKGQRPWNDFENDLGTFDWAEFYDAYNHLEVGFENLRMSYVAALEDEMAQQRHLHVAAIRECFVEWVNTIDVSLVWPKMNFPLGSRFLSFNYTSTLQKVYRIEEDQILHLHGKAESYDDLVFGHGENVEEEAMYDEDGEPTHTPFSDAEASAKYPFYAFRKPVEEIMDKNSKFFDSLSGVNQIFVIGHSLNKVDMAYFSKINAIAQSASWTVACYTNQELTDNRLKLEDYGVPNDRINVCNYSDLIKLELYM